MRVTRDSLYSSNYGNYLCGPEVQVSERGQLNELMGTGAGHLCEGETETLKIAERART